LSPLSTTVTIRGLRACKTGIPGQPALVSRVRDRRPRAGHARARKIPAQLAEDEEYQLRHERVAGIDIAKAKADVCTRLPPAREGGRRASRVEEVPAAAAEVLALAARLTAAEVTLVVMESTSDYWRIWVRHEAHCCIARSAGGNRRRCFSDLMAYQGPKG
jgi:hypothetical protein